MENSKINDQGDFTEELDILIKGGMLQIILGIMVCVFGLTGYLWLKPSLLSLTWRIFLTMISGVFVFLIIKYWPGIKKILENFGKIQLKWEVQEASYFQNLWEI